MLNISGINEGYVLDHIRAGMSLQIYHDLKLDTLEDCMVAMITNAKSNKMGRKDIIKVECSVDYLNLDVLGFIDPGITVNVIKDEKIIENARNYLKIRRSEEEELLEKLSKQISDRKDRMNDMLKRYGIEDEI